jgi:arylsulfatase A-like enzyme
MKSDKPNILLINCDDLGYGDLGCYGSERNRTPHIDNLAANGLRFTDFYMASPVCSASRAGMLTGCYPSRIGFGPTSVLFPGQKDGLNPEEKTIATYLKTAGYATKIVGKWHCGDQPEFLPVNHGFDEYYGIPFSNDMGRQVNHPDRPPLPLVKNDTVIQEQPDQRGLTERYTEECVEFIDRNKERPFFLYMAHMYVHVPLFVPKEFLERSRNGGYGGAVECIDWSTGVLVDRLKQHGLLENTLIIFTSDNGSRSRGEGGSNFPCRGTKATTWEGGQRVPCIMHWPERVRPGQTCSSITPSLDLLPTLCALAGVEPDEDRKIDGADRSDLLLEGRDASGKDVFFYYRDEGLNAVRAGEWKLHFSCQQDPDGSEIPDTPVLYNLKEDVGETVNVYDKQPEVVKDLEARADAMRKELGDKWTEMKGGEVRPMGVAENAKPLTEYREDHPYIIAMYDLPDMPTMSG